MLDVLGSGGLPVRIYIYIYLRSFILMSTDPAQLQSLSLATTWRFAVVLNTRWQGQLEDLFFFLSHHLISWVPQLCSPQLVNLAESAMGSFSEAQFENRLLELAICASVEPPF